MYLRNVTFQLPTVVMECEDEQYENLAIAIYCLRDLQSHVTHVQL